MRTAVSVGLAGLCCAGITAAQEAPFHAQLRDNLDEAASIYSDTWGDGDLGVIGRFGQNQVDLVDVSDPDNIFKVKTVVAGTSSVSAQDVKVFRSPLRPDVPLLFVSLESGGNDGVEIVDVRDPANAVTLTRIDAEPGPYELIHNVTYDDGWLYLCDSVNPSIAVIDLRTYDPDNPPASITSWTYEITNAGLFVHDVTAADGRLYASGWDCFLVYDVSDLANSAPTLIGDVRGMSSHAVWPTADGVYAVTTEERLGGAIRLYEIEDNGSSLELIQRDSYVSLFSGSHETFSAHNPVILGDRVYVANYSAGALVLQIDYTTKTLERVASYDTSFQPAAQGFQGAWGIYPLDGEDRVLVSDIDNGLYTIDFSALQLSHPNERPKTITPGFPWTELEVQVDELGNKVLQAGSVTLHASVDGGAFQAITANDLGGGRFKAALPGIACGSKIDYYFSATDTTAEVFTSPADAPATTFTTYSAQVFDLLGVDHFEVDVGWTVTNDGSLTGGAWERLEPVDSGAQPDGGDPEALGFSAFVTGNALFDDPISQNDVDGGPTVLESPDIPIAGGGFISYERWFFQDDSNADSAADQLLVEISNNSGASWTPVEVVTQSAGGWKEHFFRISDFVAPTNFVRLRFTVSDNPNDSITEAAIDTVKVFETECVDPLASAVTRNGTGVNPMCFSFFNAPELDNDWDVRVDHSAYTSPFLTYVIGHAAAKTGPIIGPGEFLVDTSTQLLLISIQNSTGTFDDHSFPVPNDVGLLGATAYTQAIIFAEQAVLCNAIDATVGF